MERFMSSTNGQAYEKQETRNGPPLDYVASKQMDSLVAQHRLYRHIELELNEATPLPESYDPKAPFTFKEMLLSDAHESFYKGVVSYLALMNMLNVANDPGLIKTLVSKSPDDFTKWLSSIASGGSVQGLMNT